MPINPRPLGIADVAVLRIPTIENPLNDHWYWCRRHVQPAKAGEPCTDPVVPDAPRAYLLARMVDCIRIGPFMTESEALRLEAIETDMDGPYLSWPALGMAVEG